MKTNRFLLALALSTSLMASAHAAPDNHRGENERYAQQRQDCEDERNNGQRKKCLREAAREHKLALANDNHSRHSNQAGCVDCGKVVGIRVDKRAGEANALGVVGGGAVGALLGNQVGGGTGRTLATVAGAVGGAYAGKKLQENHNSVQIWTVDVQYENGRRNSFQFDRDPGLQRGDRVRNAGGSIARM